MNVPAEDQNAEPRASEKSGRIRLLGIVLLAAVVLFPLSAGQKVWAGSALLVLGEVAFWAAALALGREVIRRYRRFFDPRGWFGKGRG